MARFVPSLLLALGGALGLSGAQSPVASGPPREPAAPSTPLARIVVCGASVSRGFNLANELKADVDFGDVLACVLAPEDARCITRASGGFYLDPTRIGPRLVTEVLADEPTLVVALDFLFWYGYGAVPSEEARLARLEVGLRELDRLAVPLVVSDFPDLTESLAGETPIGALMQPEYLPRPETLRALDARVRSWAEERGDVLVLPLAGFVSRVLSGEPIEVRGQPFPGGRAELFQPDLLHPTVRGAVALSLSVASLLERAFPAVEPSAFLWEPAAVRARLEARTEAERTRTLERERRRAERRRKLEERRRERSGGEDRRDGGAEEDGAPQRESGPPLVRNQA